MYLGPDASRAPPYYAHAVNHPCGRLTRTPLRRTVVSMTSAAPDLTPEEIAHILSFAEGLDLGGTVTTSPLHSDDAIEARRREMAAERADNAAEVAAATELIRRGV